jgi:hypothetical protein
MHWDKRWDDRGPGGIVYGLWIPRDPNYLKNRAKKAPESPKAPANDWIKIKVVEDQSGEVVPKVVFDLKTPNNSTEQHETRLSGMVESLGLESGNCELSGDFNDLTIDNTLVFVGVGDKPIGQQGGQQGARPCEPGKLPAPTPGSKYRIATIEEHKVKTGETPRSIADVAGMTWQALAKFNWNTDNPDEINKHLEEDVGCTKKTADGKNFIFDDSDDPGIIYLPKKWTQANLPTNQQHVIRVRFGPAKQLVEIRLYDDEMVPYANKKYSLDLDGKKYKGRLTDEGKLIREVHEGAKSGTITLWLDEDDDEVKIEIPIEFESKPLKPEMNDEGAIVCLVGLGYSLGLDDSASSPKAVMAISRFQTDYDLPSTGELDDETRSKLKEVYGC